MELILVVNVDNKVAAQLIRLSGKLPRKKIAAYDVETAGEDDEMLPTLFPDALLNRHYCLFNSSRTNTLDHSSSSLQGEKSS